MMQLTQLLQRCGRFTLDLLRILWYNQEMVDNLSQPAPEPVSAPAPEPVVTPPTAFVEEQPLMAPEEVVTEVEEKDEENLVQSENQFDELDEDLSDLEESTDTVWLLRRVGIGIIKALFILGGLGLIGWLIWGGGDKLDLKKTKEEIPLVIQSVREKIPSVKDIFTQPKQSVEGDINTSSVVLQSAEGRSLVLWNYWMETQRLANQEGILADVLIWKREVETLFEISFPQQINGETAILRDYQIGRLLQTIERFISHAGVLQQRLSQDIVEFSAKAAVAQNISVAVEQEFINALRNSNPEGISEILDKKIAAEKDLQKFSIDAEARQIFVQKISEYWLVLENVQTALTMNRAAIAQDIRVVNFPSDPFGRVISPEAWQVPQ